MAVKVVMPQVGLTTEEAKIIRWLKSEGERVEKGEPLFEVETDKAVLTVESPASGVLLKILVPEGNIAKVTQAVGVIGESGEDIASILEEIGLVSPMEVKEGKEKERIEVKKGIKEEKQVLISPLAKKIALDAGLTLEEIKKIKGTGADGAITKRDVLSYIDTLRKEKEVKVEEREPVKPSANIIPLTKMRRAIALRMAQSFREIPQFWLGVDIEVDELLRCREILNSKLPEDKHLSLTDFIVKAVALALREHPYVNATFTDEGILLKEEINIGIAVALDDGLIVPVIRNADKRSLSEISLARKNLVKKAKDGALSIEELSEGTFTVSNLGMFEIDEFMAIINPPESGILAVGRVRQGFIDKNGELKKANIMSLRLTLDHRVVDGAQGAVFFNKIRDFLENPLLLFA